MLSKANQKKMMKLLNHQLVFYVVLFLSLVSVVGQLVINNYVYVGSFVVLGALTYCFTKKPVVVLLVPLVLVNLLLSGNMVREGMKNKKDKKNKNKKGETTEDVEVKDIQEVVNNMPDDVKNIISPPQPFKGKKQGFQHKS